MKVTALPIEVSAIPWVGGDHKCLDDFCGLNWGRADAKDEQGPDDEENVVIWNTKIKQWLNVPLDYWIVRGLDGELFPCAPELFDKMFRPTGDE